VPRKRSSSAPPGQRQLRVGEELRHALSRILTREADRLNDPDLHGKSVTVTEVRMSPDLRNATVFVVPLGGSVAGMGGESGPTIKALNRAAGFFRGLVTREVKLQFSPSLRFRPDESFEQASRIEALLHDPAVSRDLAQASSVSDGTAEAASSTSPSPESGEGRGEGKTPDRER
jgi:ribosome-binding factor A